MKKKIKLYNAIAAVGTDRFDSKDYEVSETVEDPDAILVRSANLHEVAFGDRLVAVARAGAGVNNIPCDALAESGVVVFNTPGANANGVKELTVAALILASRNIVGGVEWVKSLPAEGVAKAVEKGKGQFSGHEIMGKTLGVIGLGAIGGPVANAAYSLGMKVIGCDPFLSVGAAWRLSRAVESAANYDEIYAKADYITLHVPANDKTRGMIGRETIAKMKDGVRIVNLARAELVDAEAMAEALASGKVAAYVTDFPTDETVKIPGVLNIPHLGASTEESEDNCAAMAADELIEFLESGNVRNSVNYPSVAIPHDGAARVCVCHKNVAGMLSKITDSIAVAGLNIENMANGSKGGYAYSIFEFGAGVPESLAPAIRALDGVIRVRVI